MSHFNSPEVEASVLETLMSYASHQELMVKKAMLKLSRSCFYNSSYQNVFAIILELFQQKQPFHFIDVLSCVHANDTVLHDVVTNLIANYREYHASDARFENYVDKLVQFKNLRKQLSLARHMIDDVTECTDPLVATNLISKTLKTISSCNFYESKYGITNKELADLYFMNQVDFNKTLPTTSKKINELNGGGIKAKSLVTVAAASGVGKTGFAIWLMDAIIRMQPETRALFFSLEMESSEIFARYVACCMGKQFRDLSNEEKTQGIAKCLDIDVTIYDGNNCPPVNDIETILTTSALEAMIKPVSVIVIDYLGLVTTKEKHESHAYKQSEIITKLAKLAIELNCIVIAVTQVNRTPTGRALDDRCPYPDDAAGSSGSNYSSTLWIGIDRPERYRPELEYKNMVAVKCRKNRNGDLWEFNMQFNNGTYAEAPDDYFKMNRTFASKNPEEAIFKSYSSYKSYKDD